MDSESTEELHSLHVAEVELNMDQRLCNSEGERAPRAPVSPSCPESDSVPEFSPERAPVPPSSPESPEAHK